MNITIKTRPWYGSSKKNEYRLSSDDTNEDEYILYNQCKEASKKDPVKYLNNHKYIKSGWEWSVFQCDNKVYRIPSGRFEEVNNIKYLHNAKINYHKILHHVNEEYITKTFFYDDYIEQELIVDGEELEIDKVSNYTKIHLYNLCYQLSNLLREEDWLPDLMNGSNCDFEKNLLKKNLLINKAGIPKLFDFTTYYDVFRLNEKRMLQEKKNAAEWLMWAMSTIYLNTMQNT